MDAGRDDDGRRQHVRQRAQGARRCAVQRVGPTACHHLGVFPSMFTSANWWPANLGVPSAAGGQNNVRYATFPSTRRLAIQINGVTKVFDTGEHRIGGVQQQQQGGGYGSVSFTSQFGTFDVSSLAELGARRVAETPAAAPAPQYQSQYQSDPARQFAPQTQAPAPQYQSQYRPTRYRNSHLRRRHPSLLPARPGIPRPSSRPSSRWPVCISAASSPTRSSPRRRPNCSVGSEALRHPRRLLLGAELRVAFAVLVVLLR